jgi:carbohydrate-binding DOMON domain-containing protein
VSEHTGTIEDPVGDDVGPGTYTYPANLTKGQFDVTQVDIEDTDSSWDFTVHMGVQDNQFGNDAGFSAHVLQLYLQDPNAPDDAPSSSTARPGMVSSFQEGYHYRVHIQAGSSALETPDQDPTAEEYSPLAELSASGDTENNTISFSLPKEHFDSDSLAEMKGAMMSFSQDGFGTAGIRQGFGQEAADWSFGGAKADSAETAPRILDLVGPDTVVNQSAALEYSADEAATIPLYEMDDLLAGGTIDDPEGDDTGPGTYTYPANLTKGQFDATQVDIDTTADAWEFTTHLGVQDNQFGNDAGFSAHVIQLYLQDPNAPDDVSASATPRPGMVSSFQEGYHYRVHIQAGASVLETADQDPTAEGYEPVAEISASGDTENNTISFTLPKEHIASDSLSELKGAMMTFSQDGFGTAGIRQGFGQEAADWSFGGAKADTAETAPRILDLIGPDNIVNQSESLSYSADEAASIPLFDITALATGEQTVSLTAIAPPADPVFAGMQGQLDASNSNDPSGQELTFSWAQVSGPEATLDGADTAQPTFTAPDVDEETTLQFEVTVTNEDGATATATANAPVMPQSANDAPVAEIAQGDRMVNRGSAVLLDAAPSTDPNGGELTFSWEQTGGEPSVELTGADTSAAGFTAPEPDEEVELEFTVTVGDSQGKTDTATVTITVPGAGGNGGDGDTGSGFGPGFGAIGSLVGIAGGAAYAGKRVLTGTPEDDE